MTATHWIVWAIFTVFNAALLIAAWRLSQAAQQDLEGALEHLRESRDILDDARSLLERAGGAS